MIKKKHITGIVLIIILMILSSCEKQPSRTLRERVPEDKRASSREVTFKDGVFYKKDGTLFTGCYENEETTFLLAEVKDGLLDGEVYSQKSSSEQKSRYRFKKGKLAGRSYGYEFNNPKIILWEVEFKDGDGELKEYYPDRTLKGEVKYVNYQMQGDRFIYFKDGSIKESMSYKAGKLHGEHKTYYEKDKIKYIGQYDNGTLFEAIGWHDNGKVALEKKDNVVKLYDYSGHMYRKNDLNEMNQYHYYDTGELEKVLPYLKAELVIQRKSDSFIYTYNQLGLITGKRKLFKFEFESKSGQVRDIRFPWLGDYRDELTLYNELGQRRNNKYEVDENYYYGNKSIPQLVFSWSRYTFDEHRFLDEEFNYFLSKDTPKSYDAHGRVTKLKLESKNGWGGIVEYKFNERGQLLNKNANIMGDEGESYKYDAHGNWTEHYKYGTGRKPLEKRSYVFDEEGRKKEFYIQSYNINEERGDYPEPGELLKTWQYNWLDDRTLESDITIKLKEGSRKDIIRYKYDEKDRMLESFQQTKDKEGKWSNPYQTYYLYYDSAKELSNPWPEIRGIEDSLIKKDIRRSNVPFYY